MNSQVIPVVTWMISLCVGLAPAVGQAAETAALTGGPQWIAADASRGAPWVAVGDEGGQLFAHFPPVCDETHSVATLFSTYATLTTPTWVGPTRCDRAGAVDSAAFKDVHVVAGRQSDTVLDPGPVRIALWRSGCSRPDWFYTHPTPASLDPRVGISRDASVVVAAIARADGSGMLDVVALAGSDGALRSTTPVLPASADSALHDFTLAGDGRFAALRLGTQAFVVDVVSGAVVFQQDGLSADSGAVGLSADGRVLAFAEAFVGEVTVLERVAGTWLPATTWSGAAAAGSVVLAVSDDGRTVAAGFGTFPFPGTAVFTVALDVPTLAETHSDVAILCCGIGFSVADLEITPDGERFVVGVAGGDDFDTAQRVRLYSRDQPAPLATWYTGLADLVDVALSPDGAVIAVGSSDPDGGGLVFRYTLPGSDFRVEGEPAIGAQVEFLLDGASGQSGVLLGAFQPADPPLWLPGNGTLYLDPQGLQLRPMGPVLSDGSAHLVLTVPALASLVGLPVWTQGLLMPEQQLSTGWHKLTLLP